jgi:hypothetical protein
MSTVGSSIPSIAPTKNTPHISTISSRYHRRQSLVGHYRDKGYGMGHRTGYITGLRGGRRDVRAVGVTFPDDERNT